MKGTGRRASERGPTLIGKGKRHTDEEAQKTASPMTHSLRLVTVNLRVALKKRGCDLTTGVTRGECFAETRQMGVLNSHTVVKKLRNKMLSWAPPSEPKRGCSEKAGQVEGWGSSTR